jgi:hypothetical protein
MSPRRALGRPFWPALEPSDGRDCKFGSIRWPRLQSAIETATYGHVYRYQLARAGRASRSEDRLKEPQIARLLC